MARKSTGPITLVQAENMLATLNEAILDSRLQDAKVEYDGITYTGIYVDSLDKAIRETCDKTLGRDVEPEAYRVVMFIERLARAYADWLYRVSTGSATPQGSPAVNKAIEDIVTYAKRPKSPCCA